jgi:hypothetical protein
MSMAWFNYGYSTSGLVPYERLSFVTDRGYAPGSGTYVPNTFENTMRTKFEREDDREREFTFEYNGDDELRERDYFEQLDLAPDSREPDRYGWDQYA